MNYGDVFTQTPPHCGCEGNSIQDTITVEIPGFPNCFAYITFEKTNCINGISRFESKILYMDFIVDNCPNFKDSLYPFGTSNPPDEFFMRRMWILLTSKMQQEYLNRMLVTFIPSYKEQFYCTGNPNQTTTISYSFIQGHCHKLCYAYYYYWPTTRIKDTSITNFDNNNSISMPPFGYNPNSFIRVQYLDCDAYSCCQTENRYCINPVTGELVLLSTQNYVIVSDQCDYTNPTQCVYLNLSSLGYILIPFSPPCETSCPWE